MLALEDPCPQGGEGSNCDLYDYDYESPLPLLDDNGFPSFESEDQHDDNDVENGRDNGNGNGIEAEEESFASDFYRCGTDWSSLLLEQCSNNNESKRKKNSENDAPSSERKLKQTDLFQMWGTPFTVDAFRYGHIEGCSAYFLTHFHYDHYGGLTKGWSHGPIYCSPLTARLLRMCLSVNPSFIRPLEQNIEHVIEGIRVTMLDANHCPGAALIHFRLPLPNAQCYLHTGDFRACKLMQSYPLLVNQRVHVLYLDTTYCNPKYRFPSKEDVLSFVVRVTKNWLKKQPKTLVKIYANASRKRILQSFGWPELSGNLCSNGRDTPLHVLPISHLRFETLKDYLKAYVDQYSAVLAFRPTGWTYSERIGNQLDLIKPISKGNVTIYGVPYSEHSSFTELREFVQPLVENSKRISVTVQPFKGFCPVWKDLVELLPPVVDCNTCLGSCLAGNSVVRKMELQTPVSVVAALIVRCNSS
ncbi:hypothetical protein L1049_002664 [Liquidambar formosana]|uniref:DNA repair metallo-beta-lactamase domain-containing protein n=1 Tax=Liquidambar formosana TaxID=63359 RepID=A0AAP0R913_LIQFO